MFAPSLVPAPMNQIKLIVQHLAIAGDQGGKTKIIAIINIISRYRRLEALTFG